MKTQGRRISLREKPENMTLEQWQAALRRNISQVQKFRLEVGDNPFHEKPNPYFTVRNLENRNVYELEIRGSNPHESYCSCPDYQINTLGTCKHIEYALRSLSRKTMYKSALRSQRTLKVSEVVVRYNGQRQVVFRPAVDLDARSMRVVRRYFHLDEKGGGYSLKEEAHRGFSDFVKEFEAIGNRLRVRDDAIEYVARLRDQTTLKERIDEMFREGTDSVLWKSLLKAELYAYQKAGALFAARTGRCVLADEMGLGKTLQAIAATEILARAGCVERVLVVTPTSIKYQWKTEVEKFSSRSIEVIEGPSHKRRELQGTDTFFKITNYDVVRRDLDSLNRWEPDLIILDEAQRIKNWKTSTAQNVKKLKSPYCIVLTGTPLENRIEELHSIVEFVDRFHFGPLFRFLSEHQSTDENGKLIGYKNLDRVNQSLQGLLLRRSKKEVLNQLPPRIEKTFFIPMTKEQAAYHEENSAIVARLVAKWRQHRFLSDADQKRLMTALQYMRMSCNSTYLLDRMTKHQNKITELFKILKEVFESKKSKAVIFSQWLRTHELILEWAEARKMGHVYFHGGLDGARRKAAIARFMSDPECRLFLSTDAVGVGLNLQKANVVIHMDQPWNPAILEQRIGRSHRLGQKQPVQVFHLVSQGTIEEGMLKTLAFKKSLFAGVLDGGQKEIFLGGSRLTQFMESVERAAAAVPTPMDQEVLNESDVMQETSSPTPTQSASPSFQATAKPTDPWEPLMKAGLQILSDLKIPPPSPDKVEKLTLALRSLLSP